MTDSMASLRAAIAAETERQTQLMRDCRAAEAERLEAEERQKLEGKLRSRMEINRDSGRPVELSPMYLGRKAWLLQAYQSDHRYNQFHSLLSRGSKLPLNKRVLVNYMAQQWSASNPLRVSSEARTALSTPTSSLSASGSAPPAVVVPTNGVLSAPGKMTNTAAAEEQSAAAEMNLSPVEESTPMETRYDDATSKYQFTRIESKEHSPHSAERAKASELHHANGAHQKFGLTPVEEMILSREEGRVQPKAGSRANPGSGRVGGLVTADKTVSMALDTPHNGGLSNGISNGVGHNGMDSANARMKLGNGSHLNGKLAAIESR